ncbi:ADP-ribosylation factor 1 [Aphelenchoides avenae]|nr:ADP-ribosylation factor 1 [Aphelenchus avenae]
MLSYIKKAFTRFFGKDEIRIALVGLAGVGKTTMLFKLKCGEVYAEYPAPGFEVDIIKHKSITIVSFDVDADDAANCSSWRPYLPGTHAVIFVVDSSDRDSIDNARQALDCLLSTDCLQDPVLLLFANKHDLPNAMTADEVWKHLRLESLRLRRFRVLEACAATGEGLSEGFEWLSDQIKDRI